MKNFKEKLNGVKACIFDVDGVLTNGTVTLMPDGQMLRTVSVRDGYAFQQAVKKGLRIAIITGAKSESLRDRFKALGVVDIYMDAQNKKDPYDEFILTYNLDPQEVLIMGDDLPDYEIMKRCGLPVCPADAAREIREFCMYISPFKGGEGCARDVIEQVMKAQGTWF